jgi:predicted permease
VDSLRLDVLYALRTLGRSIGFSISAVAVLALGMGVNVGFLHVINAALFHRLSVQNPESLVTFEPTRFAWPMIEFFREENTVFTHVVAQQIGVRVRVGDDDTERAGFVSPDYFSALGIAPAQGRLLVAADGETGAPAVAVLSHGYWQRRFGGDPTVVGRTVLLNGVSAEIVGVAPSNFTGLSSPRAFERASVWIPGSLYPQLFPGTEEAASSFEQRDAQMYAALRPGVELQAANSQLIALAAELKRRYPDQVTMQPEEAGRGRPLLAAEAGLLVPIALVTTLFMLVLVTACANLGNLLLARGYARMREIGVRMSLGADASRIVRQLMTENLLLAGLGAIAGLGVGYATARGLLYMVEAPPDLQVVTDWRIVVAACVLAVGTALTFGLAPARQTIRAVAAQLTQHAAVRTRRGLIAAQVAASCVLLILAAMLARSFEREFGDDLRFDFRDVVVVDPQLHAQSMAPAVARQELDEITSRLRELPAVRGVTAALYAPAGAAPPVDARGGTRVSYNSVEPSYFDVLNLPLVSGRMFEPAEEGVAILSETAAKRQWPGEDPVGKTIALPRFERDATNPGRMRALGFEQRVVVGIVADMSSEPGEAVEGYLPIAGSETAKAVLVIAADDPAGVARAARAAASRPGLVPTAWLLSAAIEESRAASRQAAAAVGGLGVTAMLLAVVGLFGVIAFAVAQRTRELGIRIALGARAVTLLATVLKQYAGAIALGGLGGCLLAFGLGNALSSRIPGLEVADPLAYVAALAVFSAVAVVAVLVPARRALKIDPMVALRYE